MKLLTRQKNGQDHLFDMALNMRSSAGPTGSPATFLATLAPLLSLGPPPPLILPLLLAPPPPLPPLSSCSTNASSAAATRALLSVPPPETTQPVHNASKEAVNDARS